MVLSEKNNYCINKEAIQNQALKTESWQLSISAAGLGAGSVGLWGCPTSSASRRAPPRQQHPRSDVRSSVPLDPALPGAAGQPGRGCLQALGTISSGNGEKRAYLIVPETLYDMY